MKNGKTLTAAASAVSLLTAASSADAMIQYFDASNGFVVEDGNSNQGWDIDGDSISEASIFESAASIFISSDEDTFRVVRQGSDLRALSSGFSLYSGANFARIVAYIVNDDGPYYAVGFTDGVAGFMGFHFNPSGTTLYGWAEIVLSSGGSFGEFEMVRWAYEDSGAAIQVGAIPEPETIAVGLGMLALGAAGLRRWRGTRKST